MAHQRSDLIHQRKSKYLAQLLARFEETIEPRIPKQVADQFKAVAREKFKLLERDAIDVMELDDSTAINRHAQAVRDTLDPDAGVGGASR